MIWIEKVFLSLLEKFNSESSESVCSSLGIPSHLHRAGRVNDDVFVGEVIFRRFLASGTKNDWSKNSQISCSIFEVKNDSCNRSKYSDSPEDVLYNVRIEDGGNHYFSWGILSIGSDMFDLFTFQINGTTRTFSLKLEHVPLDCMFPHSEIIVFENNEKVDTSKPKSVKVVIRDYLISNCDIVKSPS